MVVVLGGATGYRRRLDSVYNNARLVQIRGMSANVAATALQVMSSEEPLRTPFVVPYRRQQRNTIMDREHVKGAADKAKGAIKEGAGKLTGDKDMETEGKIEKPRDPPTTPRAM